MSKIGHIPDMLGMGERAPRESHAQRNRGGQTSPKKLKICFCVGSETLNNEPPLTAAVCSKAFTLNLCCYFRGSRWRQ